MNAYGDLLEHVNSLKIIDTHEHLADEKARAAKKHDILMEWLTHYMSSDLISA